MTRTAGSPISIVPEALVAGLAFALADALASGAASSAGRVPTALGLLILASSLLGAFLAAGIAAVATREQGRAGTTLATVLFGTGCIEALAFASRELDGKPSQLAFLVATLIGLVLAFPLARRAGRQATSWTALAAASFAVLACAPAADVVRRSAGGLPVALVCCGLPPLVAWLVAHRNAAVLVTAGALGLFLGVDPPGRSSTNRATPVSRDLVSGHVEGPDVLLLVVDTLRADAVAQRLADGASAPESGSTPSALRRLAADGLWFPQAIASAPWTLPSMSSLFTGLHPSQHGARTVGTPLAPDVTTLAERFRAAGYRTAAFTGGAFVDTPFGLDRGFDHFDPDADYRYRPSRRHTPLVSKLVRNRWFPQLWLLDHVHEFGGLTETRARLAAWLEATPGDAPRFVVVHSYQAHDYYLYDPSVDRALREARPSPLGPRLSVHPSELSALDQPELDWFRAVYDARIDRVDRELAALLALWSDRGRPTVVALTSDHGEGFDAAAGRVHHGGRLHDDLLRVPLLLAAPGWEGGRTVEEQVRTLDLGATLMELAGLEPPQDVPGRSLVPALRGEASFPASAWSEERGPLRTLRSEGWKLVETPDGRTAFDLSRDPLEHTDRSADAPTHLIETMQAFAERHPLRVVDEAALDPETLARLRALGYVD